MRKFVLRKLTILDVLQGLDEFTAPIVKTDRRLDRLNNWARGKGFKFKIDQSIFGGYFVDPTTGDSYSFNIKV